MSFSPDAWQREKEWPFLRTFGFTHHRENGLGGLCIRHIGTLFFFLCQVQTHEVERGCCDRILLSASLAGLHDRFPTEPCGGVSRMADETPERRISCTDTQRAFLSLLFEAQRTTWTGWEHTKTNKPLTLTITSQPPCRTMPILWPKNVSMRCSTPNGRINSYFLHTDLGYWRWAQKKHH